MVQRSGVEVEEILETNNGESAWEILSQREIDAVFTDIRMPKMDGIELVKRIHKMAHPPVVVAISGYDDFSYAVEMLRNGVMEYLLKPVERQKIQSVLEEINKRLQEDSNESRLAKYEKMIREEEYRIVSTGQEIEFSENDSAIRLPDQTNGIFYIFPERDLDQLLEDAEMPLGLSKAHTGAEEVKGAFEEASLARGQAFLKCRPIKAEEMEEAFAVRKSTEEKLPDILDEVHRTRRVQLIGTEKQRELIAEWEKVLSAAESSLIKADEFMAEMKESLKLLPKIYRNLFTQSSMYDSLEKLNDPLSYDDLSSYRDELFDFLLSLNEKSRLQDETEPMRRKMSTAVEYIRENYAKDLNMAVVSNYISMNYSLFSHAFKAYTGQNFVTYLKELRMQEVRRLLVETDDKIIDIAKDVGYDNYKHFLKLFRMEYGVSPTEYRRNMQREN